MSNIRTAMNRGAFDFVTKPIDFADLEMTIAKTLHKLEITRGYQRRWAGGGGTELIVAHRLQSVGLHDKLRPVGYNGSCSK